MARFRLAPLARTDVVSILATSLERWGVDGRARYAALLDAAMHSVAVSPSGPTTRDRADLRRGTRSFHIRHTRGKHGVAAPVHVLYYRAIRPDLIEIGRVLHERMEPSRHFDEPGPPTRKPARRARRR